MLGAEDLMPDEVGVEGLNVEGLDDDRLLDDDREDTRLANQSGNLGADLGLAGITFLFPLEVDETLDGNFILGNPVTLGELMGEDFDCSRLKVKSCPLKARVKVSLSRSKDCALYSSYVVSLSLIHSPKLDFLLKIQKCGMPLSRKYPRNSTSFANAGSIIGLGGGGGGLIVGGGRLEPGLRNGFPATPPQENEDKTIKERRLMYNLYTALIFQIYLLRARNR
jgi:hypothetical protein